MEDKTAAFSEGLRNDFETHMHSHTEAHTAAAVSGSWWNNKDKLNVG